LGANEFLDAEEQAAATNIIEVPEQVQEELLVYRPAKTLLAGNTWMVVIMLAIAFMDLEHEVFNMSSNEQ